MTSNTNHILRANCQSKAKLRSLVGEISQKVEFVDYFPAYEIITNPRMHSSSYTEGLTEVRKESMEFLINSFFHEHSL